MLRVVGSLRPSLRRSRAGVVAISSGKLSAKAKHIKPSTTQEGEVFRMETLVLGEMIAEGVGHFSPKPNNNSKSGKNKCKVSHIRRLVRKESCCGRCATEFL